MKFERKFVRCEICGNLVGVVEDGGAKLVCCGQEMTPLVPNTADASQEKHVPVVAKREDCLLTVSVGSAAHPMSNEHHIAWIMVAQGNLTQRAALEATGEPSAEFCIREGGATLYAYCNLHGLWAADI